MARHLIAGVLLLGAIAAAGCSSKAEPEEPVEPEYITAPLPTGGMASQSVTLYPNTLVAAEQKLDWEELMGPRAERVRWADSLIKVFLDERVPEVAWVWPEELRRMARQAPGILANPDQMGTALLRGPDIVRVPDPLRSQMRNLTGVTGDRFALVPAALAFFETDEEGVARVEWHIVLVDVRGGNVEWRTIAHGEGTEPRAAAWDALTELVPGLP
jgi:hypothetical protein